MSGSQMAHCLKVIGNGSEMAGIRAVYRKGWLAGAGQTTVSLVGGYLVYRIGKWGYEKLQDYLYEQGYLAEQGGVV